MGYFYVVIYLMENVLPISSSNTVADPGFPIVGVLTRWGGANLRCVHFSVKTYAKNERN